MFELAVIVIALALLPLAVSVACALLIGAVIIAIPVLVLLAFGLVIETNRELGVVLAAAFMVGLVALARYSAGLWPFNKWPFNRWCSSAKENKRQAKYQVHKSFGVYNEYHVPLPELVFDSAKDAHAWIKRETYRYEAQEIEAPLFFVYQGRQRVDESGKIVL